MRARAADARVGWVIYRVDRLRMEFDLGQDSVPVCGASNGASLHSGDSGDFMSIWSSLEHFGRLIRFTNRNRLLALRRRRRDQGRLPGDQEHLLRHRLDDAGLDPDYVRVVRPALFDELAQGCRACGENEQCARDIASADFGERVVEYCPNTPKIDALIVKK